MLPKEISRASDSIVFFCARETIVCWGKKLFFKMIFVFVLIVMGKEDVFEILKRKNGPAFLNPAPLASQTADTAGGQRPHQ